MSGGGGIHSEKLKSLIDFIFRVNSNYADSDELPFLVLQAATELVSCESATFIFVKNSITSLNFLCGAERIRTENFSFSEKSVASFVLQTKKSVFVNHPENEPDLLPVSPGNVQNFAAVFVKIGGKINAVLEAENKKNGKRFHEEDLLLLQEFLRHASLAFSASAELEKKSVRLKAFESAGTERKFHPFVAHNHGIVSLLEKIRVWSEDSAVLILGESGVGKEIFAEQIHLFSSRKKNPFVRVNCTQKIESLARLFDSAAGGTIFFDEISALNPVFQDELLHFLQNPRNDVRIMASTKNDLEKMVKDGVFSGDLYFRLNVLTFSVPPLRDRRDEIEFLCDFFLQKFSAETHKNFSGFSDAAKSAIFSYIWRGNVRELENTILRGCISGTPPLIQANDLRLPFFSSAESDHAEIKNIAAENSEHDDKTLKTALDNFKREYIVKILQETNWNKTKAAKIMDVQRTYLSRLISELGIKK